MIPRWKLLLIGSLILGLAIGLTFVFIEPRLPEQKVIVEQQASYKYLAREEMIDSADAIFRGKVFSISPTHWNQDSGEEWNDNAIGGDSGFQVHEVEIEVLQAIVDGVGLDKRISITLIGSSPLDGYGDHNLKEGVEAVFFMRQTEIAWREGGTRPIFELMTAPVYSYFQLGGDGLFHDERPDGRPLSLEDIVKSIAQRRAILAQP